jgi:type IV pilus assembly protein PilN
MRFSTIFKAKPKEGFLPAPTPGSYKEPYRHQPPRKPNFLDKAKALPKKLPTLHLPKNKKSKAPTHQISTISQMPKAVKLPAVKIKAERVKRRPQNISLAKSAGKFLKTLSEDIAYCYDRSISFFTLYNLRHEGLIGIDITPHCIYLCQIDGMNGKRVLTSLTSVCMEGKFLNKDISENPNDYADSLKTLIKDNNIKTKNVALSIPVSNSIVKTVTIPTMDDEEIQKALRFGSLWNNLMSSKHNPEDYSIFYQVIRRKKSHETMDVLFVATKLSDVGLYTDIVKNSGLNPVIVDVRCFAINNAFNNKRNIPQTGGPNVFLEFGPAENYAMIIDNDGAHIFDIYISDEHRTAMTDNLMDVETLTTFSESFSTQVKNTIAEYEAKHKTDPIKNIFVLSSIPTTNTIIDKFSDLLQEYAISHCNFFDCMNIKDDFTISAKSARQTISAWAGCIGTALRRIDILSTTPEQYHTNMLPNPHLYVRQKRIKYLLNCACAAASVALISFVVITQRDLNAQNKELSLQLSQLNGVEENYKLALAKYNQLEIATNDIDAVGTLTAEVGTNQKRLMALHQYLSMVLVDNVWLKEMTFSEPNNIEIIGASTEDKKIVEFISLLNEGKQFDKIALKGMQEVHEMSYGDPYAATVKNFTITGTISANPPPLVEITPVTQNAPEPTPVNLISESGDNKGV